MSKLGCKIVSTVRRRVKGISFLVIIYRIKLNTYNRMTPNAKIYDIKRFKKMKMKNQA